MPGFGDKNLDVIVVGKHYPQDRRGHEYVDGVLSLEQEAPSVVNTYRMAAKATATRHGGLGAPSSVTGYSTDLLHSRAKNINGELETNIYVINSLLIIAGLILTSYGAIHSAAWNSKFPNAIEKWRWRSSALLITAFPWLLAAAIFYIESDGWASVFMDRYNQGSGAIKIFYRWAGRAHSCIQLSVMSVVLTAGVFARIFIVLESFISLRAVPIGVYVSIPWSNFIPHI